jgi:predicted membrane-bound dolichyl-phosphate-mannose-protein mannosyltransferase
LDAPVAPTAEESAAAAAAASGLPETPDGGRLGRVVRGARRARAAVHARPLVVLGVVLALSLGLRLVWLDQPGRSLVFDESYYVNAARVILGWEVREGAHYDDKPAFLDPNTEHPPLGKLFMAASMSVFGDNGWGWRLPSVIAGMIVLAATYGIVRTTGESRWFGVLAVSLLAFDNLTFVHGRIGTLDMMALAPVLVGSWLSLRRHWILAAIAMAIGVLIKITALYGVAAVLLMYLVQVAPGWWRARRIVLDDLRAPLAFGIVFATISFTGLSLLDARFTAFASPFDHLRRIFEYGSALAAPVLKGGFCPEADSRPWQWLFNECQIAYLRIDVTVRAGEELVRSTPRVDFRGAMNPVLVGVMPISAIYTLWYGWKTRGLTALWALTWAATSFLPFVALALLTTRIMYIYYMIPVLPAVAVMTAILLLRSGLPRVVLYGFVVAYALAFIAYFPFREVPI